MQETFSCRNTLIKYCCKGLISVLFFNNTVALSLNILDSAVLLLQVRVWAPDFVAAYYLLTYWREVMATTQVQLVAVDLIHYKAEGSSTARTHFYSILPILPIALRPLLYSHPYHTIVISYFFIYTLFFLSLYFPYSIPTMQMLLTASGILAAVCLISVKMNIFKYCG